MPLWFALAACPSHETAPTGDFDGLTLAVDPDMPLMLHAAFPDPGSTEAWIEYRFEGESWLVAPLIAPGEATILGIPQRTAVEARAAAVVDGRTLYSVPVTATTGWLPVGLIPPEVTVSAPSLAADAPYAMITVASGRYDFQGPYFVQIVDRLGRVVWYHRVRDDLISMYAAPARDGTHIWFEAEDIFGLSGAEPSVTRRTLDGRWSLEWSLPNLGQAIGEGPSGSFFYELRADDAHGVNRLDPDGATSVVWDCGAHMEAIGRTAHECLLNTTNWDLARDTVLASQFLTSTVFEIDVPTGTVLRQLGQLTAGDPYTFVPPDSVFAYQHYPTWTEEGTLLVSTHASCDPADHHCAPNFGAYGIQIVGEYVVDDAEETITLVDAYVSTDLWATQAGGASRAPNGNLLVSYGQDGAVREVTPDGAVAWQVEWEPGFGGYRTVGHLSLIDDLYALNRGPE